MMFGLWTRVGHRNHVLGGGPDPPKGRGNFGASPSQLCSKGIPSTSQSYSLYGSSSVAFHCQNCSNLLFLCSRSIVLVCWTKIHSHCSQLSATMSNLFPKQLCSQVGIENLKLVLCFFEYMVKIIFSNTTNKHAIIVQLSTVGFILHCNSHHIYYVQIQL